MKFWNTDTEIQFFKESLKNFASPEQLFYKISSDYLAYVPKNSSIQGQTLQSRNSLIGQFTEKWCKDFLQPIANELGLYAVNGVTCPEIGLVKNSSADLAFCKTNNTVQNPTNIKIVFEIKMSIVNNYKYDELKKAVIFLGDYKTHRGNPSILRSDSMLKAIGKSINIRVSNYQAAAIPIVVIGNTPISKNYIEKVDFLKQAGIIQSFISFYPNSTQDILFSPKRGFQTFKSYSDLTTYIKQLSSTPINYFSSMLPKKELGKIISISANEKTNIKKAEKFLALLKK